MPELFTVVSVTDVGDENNTKLFAAFIKVFPFVRRWALMLLRVFTGETALSEMFLFASLQALLAMVKAVSVSVVRIAAILEFCSIRRYSLMRTV